MHSIAVIVVLLVLLVLIKPLIRIAMLLLVRTACRGFLTNVGQKAMDQQPDEIHLKPATDHQWTDGAAVEALATPLVGRGFEAAGDPFGITEMPQVFLRFLIQPEQRVGACIYEHPKIGTWIDLFSHFT